MWPWSVRTPRLSSVFWESSIQLWPFSSQAFLGAPWHPFCLVRNCLAVLRNKLDNGRESSLSIIIHGVQLSKCRQLLFWVVSCVNRLPLKRFDRNNNFVFFWKRRYEQKILFYRKPATPSWIATLKCFKMERDESILCTQGFCGFTRIEPSAFWYSRRELSRNTTDSLGGSR